MKTTMLYTLTVAALTSACASDRPSDTSAASDDDVSVQVAFYGLTVVDCQQEATKCFQDKAGNAAFRRQNSCSTKLTRCLGKASAEAAKNVADEAADVAQCGKTGSKCFTGAAELSAVLACQDKVETCVLGSVNELTGIPLPTTQQVAGEIVAQAGEIVEHATEHVGEVTETAAKITGEIVETGATVVEHVAEHAVETAVAVTDHAVGTTRRVAGDVLETTGTLTGNVLETATTVVDATVETGVAAAKSALQCGEESGTCIRTTKKLLSCQLAYAECLSSAL